MRHTLFAQVSSACVLADASLRLITARAVGIAHDGTSSFGRAERPRFHTDAMTGAIATHTGQIEYPGSSRYRRSASSPAPHAPTAAACKFKCGELRKRRVRAPVPPLEQRVLQGGQRISCFYVCAVRWRCSAAILPSNGNPPKKQMSSTLKPLVNA